jgi:hypothetical protein
MLAKADVSAYITCMQYTIRNVPKALDAALRARMKAESKSLNEVAVQALARGLGFSKEDVRYRDLSELAGSWKEDPEFDRAMSELHAIDRELWK